MLIHGAIVFVKIMTFLFAKESSFVTTMKIATIVQRKVSVIIWDIQALELDVQMSLDK